MPMMTQIITAIIQIITCYIFIIQFQWGIIGAAIATNVAYIFNMIILDFWCAFHSEDHFKNMWLGWARSSMEGLGSFLEYGISSAMIECFHLYVIQLLAFLAAYQNSQSDFATQVVIMNMYSFVHMIP